MAESTENDENNNPNQGDNDQRQPQGGDQKPTKNRRNRNNNNNKRRRNRKNKKNREKVLSIKYKKPDWDGMIDGLDEHAFQHPDEHPPNTQHHRRQIGPCGLFMPFLLPKRGKKWLKNLSEIF